MKGNSPLRTGGRSDDVGEIYKKNMVGKIWQIRLLYNISQKNLHFRCAVSLIICAQ